MTFTEMGEQQFAQCLNQAQGAERGFREHAWNQYLRLGLPDRKNESWKYTSLFDLKSMSLTAAPPAPRLNIGSNREQVTRSSALAEVAELAQLIERWQPLFAVAVTVNGRLIETLGASDSGYTLTESRGVVAAGEFPVVNLDDGFLSLSSAIHGDGYALRVKAKGPLSKLSKPLLLIHWLEGDGIWAPTLNYISVDRGLRLQLAELFVGASKGSLRTDVTIAQVAEDACLTWVRSQEESRHSACFTEAQVELHKNSNLEVTQVIAGGSWSRNVIRVALNDNLARAEINGITFGSGRQHHDQRVQANHHAAETTSVQNFKGILSDHAHGVLNGRIFIARDAQNVISRQMNHNVLLGPFSEANTKPELEIHASEVKANHGATVGRLDEEALFYLQSRGITPQEARQILARAFVNDVLVKVQQGELRGLMMDRARNLVADVTRQLGGVP